MVKYTYKVYTNRENLSNKMLQQQPTFICKLSLVARKSLHEWVSCNHWVLNQVGGCLYC